MMAMLDFALPSEFFFVELKFTCGYVKSLWLLTFVRQTKFVDLATAPAAFNFLDGSC